MMFLTRLLPIVLILGSAGPVIARQPSSLEYDVRAAFVLNFVRYVEWPPDERKPPLRICVLEPNPFGGRLTALVAGEQWYGGTIDVQVVANMGRAADCHLLYVPAAAMSRYTSNASVVAGRPVLTVGEHERFIEQGGVLQLFLEDNRVRFSVNQQSADRAGLQISSRLLRLARIVIGATP